MKRAVLSKLRGLLGNIMRPLLLRVVNAVPVDDAWEQWEQRIPSKQFGSGCIRDWPWFFEGQSTVKVKSVEEVCRWLSECCYAHDKTVFNESDFWQHPVTFETTRKGDCEDHALWAWRKLTELGYRAEFVRGRYFDGRDLHRTAHAAVIFEQHGRRYFLDTVAKGGRKMVMTVITARALFCPECSVDSSFKTYRYSGRTLIMQRSLRDGEQTRGTIQQDGAANGSQPSHSERNGTSSAAGSRR
jgi:hypothetical protein